MIFFNNVIKLLKERYIFHPFLVIIYFLLHHLISFDNNFKWSELLVSFLTLLSIGFVLHLIIKIIILDKFNASYFLSFVLLLFLFYEDIHSILNTLLHFKVRNRYLLPSISIVAILLFLFLRRSNRIYRLNLFLNGLLIIYLLVDITSWVGTKFDVNRFLLAPNPTNKINMDEMPDIHLLLVDGYASNENLEKYYQFKNDNFSKFLTKNNFRLIKNAKSNYFFTVLTMSSALNLRYHNPQQSNLHLEAFSLIKNNVFTQTLEEYGYEINNLSVFNIKDYNAEYGLKIWMNRSSLFFYYFSKTPTFTLLVRQNKGEGLPRELSVFDALNRICRTKSQKPKFVYTHILLPHIPFYLDSFGRYDKKVDDRNPSLTGIANLIDKDAENNTMGSAEADSLLKIDYINHIKFTNKKCSEAITNILNHSNRPPIIILMSDHGSRMLTNPVPNSEAIKERYDNFCAIYYPDKNYSKLHDSITPINVMRQVLNKSVGTKYANLKDVTGLVIE